MATRPDSSAVELDVTALDEYLSSMNTEAQE